MPTDSDYHSLISKAIGFGSIYFSYFEGHFLCFLLAFGLFYMWKLAEKWALSDWGIVEYFVIRASRSSPSYFEASSGLSPLKQESCHDEGANPQMTIFKGCLFMSLAKQNCSLNSVFCWLFWEPLETESAFGSAMVHFYFAYWHAY